MPCIQAVKSAILGKDSIREAEGICSQLEIVRSDILLEACAVWEGSFTQVTGWVLLGGIKLTQNISNMKHLFWIKLCGSSDLNETGFTREASCSGSFSFCPFNLVLIWIL